ncbi:MAG: uridylate kinase [Planctomycetes bacterium SM23_25]|nr:MAG: uridylate kinase [Planctomycetes bacterium SM23_25]
MAAGAYNRVLLKISGEGFCKPGGFGVDPEEVRTIARQVGEVAATGCELAIVVGGGNFLRGAGFAKDANVGRATADYMGMVATVINALALQECLEAAGVDTRVQSAVEMQDVAEPFIRRRCIRHLEKKRVVILAGGTGNPFFTTDTAAALRASELRAQVLLKATKVDGVYSDDPERNPQATRFDHLTYSDVVQQDLKIIDMAAISLCRESRIPIVVFNLKREGNIRKVIAGEPIGTRIGD